MTYKTMNQLHTQQTQARENELNRIKVREMELNLEQKQLQCYREQLEQEDNGVFVSDSEEENHFWETEAPVDRAAEEESIAEENEEAEREREHLAKVAERRKKRSGKNHKFR